MRELKRTGSVLDGFSYSLADVGYRVHPAANANFVAYIWRVAELVHDSDVVGIGTLEKLLFQRNRVNLQEKNKKIMDVGRPNENHKKHSQ